MKTTSKKATLVLCIIFFLSIFLWGCYEVNFEVASKMKWWELILSATGMVCGLVVALFFVWMVRVLATGKTFPIELE